MGERPTPPDELRCIGVYGYKYKGGDDLIGTRCRKRKTVGEFCENHRPLPDEKRCTARVAMGHDINPGGRCARAVLPFQKVCGMHGGRAKQNLQKARRQEIEENAMRLARTYGLKIETTASEALLDEVQWTAGHVAWLRERVQEIEDAAAGDGENSLVWGVTRRKEGGEDRGVTEEAAPSVWLKLYQTERNHLVKVCSEAIRAGIEERRVQLAEQQGQLVAQVIRRVLDDLDLSAEQLQRVPDIVPRHLRSLAG